MNICQSKISVITSIADVLNLLTCLIIQNLVPLLFAIAIVGFMWGVIQMVINPEDAEKRKKGKEYMIWGIIALFVMLSIWGLVEVIAGTFGIGTFIPKLSQ